MAAPLVKVGILFAKTVTKIVTKNLKKTASHEGYFRDICLKFGRMHHILESRMQLKLMGHTVKKVKPIADDAAIEIGYIAFSEGIVLITAIGLLSIEYARKDYIDTIKKEEAAILHDIEKKTQEQRFQVLEEELAQIKAVNESLTLSVNTLISKLPASNIPKNLYETTKNTALKLMNDYEHQ